MSIPYELTGRTQQKARTRDALVGAARDLLGGGVTPTVERAAAAAHVSRSTAFRYFPNQRSLLVACFPELGAKSLLPDPAPAEPEARLDAVTEALVKQIVEHERELRTQLRLSLEDEGREDRDLPLRTGRAVGWIEDALEPLRGQLGDEGLRRLASAIRCAVGIESLVWLTDIGGLSRREAVELMRWSARALLRAALAPNGQGAG